MDRIDLHAHTNRSDGTLEPWALVAAAKSCGLRALAVTDHDTTAALSSAREAGRSLGVEVLPGIEITTRFPGRAMHVLAYGFDEHHRGLLAMLEEIVGHRDGRNLRILAKLATMGCPMTIEEVHDLAAGDVVARPHIAQAMVRRGYVPDVRTAFSMYLKDGGPAYEAAEAVEPAEAIAMVHEAGGVAVVAHPRQLRLADAAAARALFADLVAVGLDGIEVQHPSHHADDRALFASIAKAHGLLETGGSDFHGESKPDIRLGVGDGSVHVTWETWEAVRDRCARSRG